MTASAQWTWKMRAAAVGWLRYERRCFLVCWERSPFVGICRPDLIGIERKRRAIEVEFKQSIGDLKANATKRGMIWRNANGIGKPLQFYFAVPRELVERVKPMLAEGDGLITLGDDSPKFGPQVEVVRGAAFYKQAEALSKFAIGRMIMHQTGTLHRACVAMARHDGTVAVYKSPVHQP